MKILQIKTDNDLKIALVRVEELWEKDNVNDLNELDALATLISDYENKVLLEESKANQKKLKGV